MLLGEFSQTIKNQDTPPNFCPDLCFDRRIKTGFSLFPFQEFSRIPEFFFIIHDNSEQANPSVYEGRMTPFLSDGRIGEIRRKDENLFCLPGEYYPQSIGREYIPPFG
jgi:hypothetical protein